MDPKSFLAGRSRETTIARDARGRWFHDGQLLEHDRLTRAFERWVSRAEDGRYCLKNSINWAYISLEGAPFFVRAVRPREAGFWLVLNDERQVPLDLRSLREGPDGVLYCDVGEGMAGRFDSHAAVQLGEHAEEDEAGLYFLLDGERVRPPAVSDPLAGTG